MLFGRDTSESGGETRLRVLVGHEVDIMLAGGSFRLDRDRGPVGGIVAGYGKALVVGDGCVREGVVVTTDTAVGIEDQYPDGFYPVVDIGGADIRIRVGE